MNQNYLGAVGSDSMSGPSEQRYFYALRTDEDGNVYFTRIDIMTSDEGIQVNNPGDATDDWEYFELGIDYFEGKRIAPVKIIMIYIGNDKHFIPEF